MDLFNKKKIEELEYKNETLELKVKQLEKENALLQNIVDNKGYVVPKIHKLIFTNAYSQLVKVHFSSVINFMNSLNIEIVSHSVNDTGFVIEYRLPQNISNIDFSFTATIDASVCGTINYQTKFNYKNV